MQQSLSDNHRWRWWWRRQRVLFHLPYKHLTLAGGLEPKLNVFDKLHVVERPDARVAVACTDLQNRKRRVRGRCVPLLVGFLLWLFPHLSLLPRMSVAHDQPSTQIQDSIRKALQ